MLDTLLAEARGSALLDSMRIALAMRQYHADNDNVPGDPGELAPEYLDELPKDPFTGEDYRVKAGGGSVTVYSVGKNGKDDGGDVADQGDRRRAPDTGVTIAL